ncbi:MAG: elongation factor P maturation arginine rhamnosyltransferase EarP [Burkholderiales bacterium]
MAGNPGLRLHLYCRVVDNYGDAGVSWRLARQLAAEHGIQVTLWIDRPDVLRQLAPGAPDSHAAGEAGLTPDDGRRPAPAVTVRPWPDDEADCLPDPDIVVCAFGCDPPPGLRARLAGAPARPLWINLEYLSAEAWVDGCHGLAAIKPADGAREHFFFPGFRPGTGGLLREHDLLARRDAFRRSDAAARWWQAMGLPALPGRRVSVFCYPDAPLLPLLRRLAAGPGPTIAVIPQGVAEAALAAFLAAHPADTDERAAAPGLTIAADSARRAAPPGTACSRHGHLVLARPPWLDIDDYDRLLWSCDLNLVRGEDSWIRALWAGRPMVWQPYRQADGAHQAKLEAFLAWRRQPAWPAADAPIEAFSRAWSEGTDPAPAWAMLEAAWPALETAAATLAAEAARAPDLATQLVSYCRSRL